MGIFACRLFFLPQKIPLEGLSQILSLLYSDSPKALHLADSKSQSRTGSVKAWRAGMGGSCAGLLANLSLPSLFPLPGSFPRWPWGLAPSPSTVCSNVTSGLRWPLFNCKFPFPFYHSSILHIIRIICPTQWNVNSKRARGFVFLHWSFVEEICLEW